MTLRAWLTSRRPCGRRHPTDSPCGACAIAAEHEHHRNHWPTRNPHTVGALVVDEVIVPLTALYLSRGAFCWQASTQGPVRSVDAMSYALHDQEGGLVVATANTRLRWEAITEGGRLTSAGSIVFRDKVADGWDRR